MLECQNVRNCHGDGENRDNVENGVVEPDLARNMTRRMQDFMEERLKELNE